MDAWSRWGGAVADGGTRRTLQCLAAGIIAGSLALVASPTIASGSSEVVGSCAVSSIDPSSDGVAPIMLSTGIPAEATITKVELDISWTGTGSDIVAGLVSPNDTMAGLVAGVDGTAFDVTFSDSETGYAGDISADGSGLAAGAVAPLEPFSAYSGLTPSGSWSVAFLNTSDETPLVVTACELRLSLTFPAQPTTTIAPSTTVKPITATTDPSGIVGPAAPATPTLTPVGQLPETGSSVVATALIALVVLGVGLVGWFVGRRRRYVAGVVLVALTASAVAVIADRPSAVLADVVVPFPDRPPPTHPWGQKPDGRIVIAGAWVKSETFDEQRGLFSAPRNCGYEECMTTLTVGDDRDPDVSPTGFQIAFIRAVRVEVEPQYFRRIDQLAVLDLRDGSVRVLASTKPHDLYYSQFDEPSWSPDEQRIAYGDSGDIMIIDADGGTPSTIPGGLGSQLSDCARAYGASVDRSGPTWSPNGTTIAYLRSVGYPPPVSLQVEQLVGHGFLQAACPYGERSRVFISSISTHDGEQAVAADIGWIDSIDFSPNGTQLALGRDGTIESSKPTDFAGAWLEPIGPGTRVQLSTGWTNPRWSPDGEFLAGIPPSGSFAQGVLKRPDGTPYHKNGCSLREDIHSWGSDCYGVYNGQVSGGLTDDPQCKPGSCLSGIMLSVVGEGTTTDQEYGVSASGALQGQVFPYKFAKAEPGTHVVTVSAPGVRLTGITCDDTDSTVDGALISYQVEESEIVECIIQIGPLNDRDGDGISDANDRCPDDPQDRCLDDVDTDGDGLYDGEDPCPTDATNTCEEDPNVTKCKAFQVDVIGDIAMLDWFRFNTSGTACGATGDLQPTLSNLERSGEVVLPAVTVGIMSLIFSVKYDRDANANKIEYDDDGAGAVITGSFDLCALPLPPGLGKFAGKAFLKLSGIASRFGAQRLIAKVTNVWLSAYEKLIRYTWEELGGFSAESAAIMTQAIRSVDDSLKSLFENALGNGLSNDELDILNLCVPMWEPSVSLQARPDGKGVYYEIWDQGFPVPRVAIATNATPI